MRTSLVRSSGDLGQAIADVRLERGLTQAALAERVGVNRTYLAKLEAGAAVLLLDRSLRILRRLGAEVTVTLPGPEELITATPTPASATAARPGRPPSTCS